MRRTWLLFAAGLTVAFLVIALGASPVAAQGGPTPTVEACHVCDDGLLQEAQQARPGVRAVLFWEEGCPYCAGVIDHVLPPLQAEYGAQLEIVLIQVLTQQDQDQLYAVAASFGIPEDRVVVPFLVLGDQVLLGATQIRDQLPGLIAERLGRSQTQPAETRAPAVVLLGEGPEDCGVATPCADGPAQTPGPSMIILTDPPAPAVSAPDGFGLAAAVLAGMVAALVFVGARAWRAVQADALPAASGSAERQRNLVVPALSLIGLGVAAYLAYVETQMVEAACGPVGDCNAVQTSSYARLFGVLPLGVLGMVGYAAILAGWAWGRLRHDRLADLAPTAVFGMALFGTLFSIYLTYVELFVLRAVCIWCIISAAVMTFLLLFSLDPVLRGLVEMPDDEEKTA